MSYVFKVLTNEYDTIYHFYYCFCRIIDALATVYHDTIWALINYGFNIYSAGKDFSIPIALTGTFVEGAVLIYLIQCFKPTSGVVRLAL